MQTLAYEQGEKAALSQECFITHEPAKSSSSLKSSLPLHFPQFLFHLIHTRLGIACRGLDGWRAALGNMPKIDSKLSIVQPSFPLCAMCKIMPEIVERNIGDIGPLF